MVLTHLLKEWIRIKPGIHNLYELMIQALGISL